MASTREGEEGIYQMTICFPGLSDVLLSAVRSRLTVPWDCWLLKMAGGVLPWLGGGDRRDISVEPSACYMCIKKVYVCIVLF